MYDRTVRRRRAVLALLVVVSLILLTASFGHSAVQGLGAIQRGALVVLSPIQDVASRALKPVRDLTGWFSSTLNAKQQRDQLRVQYAQELKLAVSAVSAERQNVELRRLLGLDQRGLGDYQPVAARVIGASPTVWFATVTIDKGSSDGVRLNQPVINDLGLVGTISAVWADGSQVTLITDHTSGVSARINQTGDLGVVEASAGDPNDLRLDYVSNPKANIAVGEQVVTSGSISSQLQSLFPPNIPIGQVSRVDNPGTLDQLVHITPYANLHQLDIVQVLTRPTAGTIRAQAGTRGSG